MSGTTWGILVKCVCSKPQSQPHENLYGYVYVCLDVFLKIIKAHHYFHLKILCNKYTIKGETDHQPRLDEWDKCSGLVHGEDPEGWDGEGGGRRDRDGEHM